MQYIVIEGCAHSPGVSVVAPVIVSARVYRILPCAPTSTTFLRPGWIQIIYLYFLLYCCVHSTDQAYDRGEQANGGTLCVKTRQYQDAAGYAPACVEQLMWKYGVSVESGKWRDVVVVGRRTWSSSSTLCWVLVKHLSRVSWAVGNVLGRGVVSVWSSPGDCEHRTGVRNTQAGYSTWCVEKAILGVIEQRPCAMWTSRFFLQIRRQSYGTHACCGCE